MEIKSEAQMNELLKNLEEAKFVIKEIKKSERTRKAPLPFTTSTLQQEAAKALNYSTKKTMQLAQQLYEGIEIKGHGTLGLITYLRTDSIRVSDEADQAAKEYIKNNFGEEFVTTTENQGRTGKKIQDAHEAIRPTYIDLTPNQLKESK